MIEDALRERRIVRLRADMTDENPEAAALLEELGNAAQSIPFVAVYSWTDPDKPITLADVFTRQTLLRVLEQVAPSRAPSPRVAEPTPSEPAVGETSSVGAESSILQGEAAPQGKEVASKERGTKAHDLWRPFSVEEAKALQARGVPLVVDWTADW